MSILKNSTCPHCRLPLREYHDFVTCTTCLTSYHEKCWQENDGCALCRAAEETAAVDPPASVSWYLYHNYRNVGPLTWEELCRYPGIGPDDLVWHKDLPDWIRAAEVSDLPLEESPPPLPAEEAGAEETGVEPETTDRGDTPPEAVESPPAEPAPPEEMVPEAEAEPATETFEPEAAPPAAIEPPPAEPAPPEEMVPEAEPEAEPATETFEPEAAPPAAEELSATGTALPEGTLRELEPGGEDPGGEASAAAPPVEAPPTIQPEKPSREEFLVDRFYAESPSGGPPAGDRFLEQPPLDRDPTHLDEARRQARHVVSGILLVLGGSIAAAATSYYAVGGRGTVYSIVAAGAIIFGVVDFLRGLFGWLKQRS